ncbi:BAP1, transcription factor bZIP [Calycina marina]|uniref:BAP1, transcription factor bZIP n=1 Tax=Calycina marina TaxID=1763456 RepID=A0A9P7Z257_9HELO|nr:BAP1, transcription factor bZIP [Calycina marina]
MDPSTLPSFTLSPRQEEPLFAALTANGPGVENSPLTVTNDNFSMAPGSLMESPIQVGNNSGFEERRFIDYDYDFEADGSFDYGDFSNDNGLIGKPLGISSDGDADTHEKRSHPDDDEDDEEGGGKRRESEEKGSKKPGRKPLTSEPTSKRKAQNRAAQRAFRERKERHLKDLETKVDDLEKASENANHENSILRAQIEKMSIELQEYRKRVALNGNPRNPSLNSGLPAYLANKGINGNSTANNPNDINFQFEFPKFGRLPGPPSTTTKNSGKSAALPITLQQTLNPLDRSESSPVKQTLPGTSAAGFNTGLNQVPALMDGGDMSGLSGLFSPATLESISKSSSYDFFGTNTNGSRSSTDTLAQNSTGHNTSHSSPSASSNSNHGPSSSCGTSPEPTTQSPVYKASETNLTTIGEEPNNVLGQGELTFCDKLNMACGNPNNPVPRTMSETSASSGNMEATTFDINGIDWFAQQNGNQFDPQLFGDYREPQQNILSSDVFSDSFFSDAYALPDFNSPFNIALSPAAPKKDLVAQIDEKLDEEEVVPGEDPAKLLTCNTIWDRLQACPKVKEGGFDLDLLCKDLQKKAKCSETGAVVNESDFNKIMKSYAEKNKNKA